MATHNQRLITFMGQTHNLATWARKFNLSPQTITARLARGMSVKDALQTPPWRPSFRVLVETPAGELTAHELAKMAGVSEATIYRRRRKGWADDDLVAPGAWHKITANGVTLSIRQWAKVNGIKLSTIYYRIYEGWDPADAVTRPAMGRGERRGTQITAWGKTQNLAQWAKEVGISYPTLLYRIKQGCPPEVALTAPVERCGPRKKAND